MSLFDDLNDKLSSLNTGQGGGQGTVLDTGTIGSGPDQASNHPMMDADIFSYPGSDGASLVSVGVLPEPSPGHGVADVDILSGSYGGGEAAVIDIGPDIFQGPGLVSGTALAHGSTADLVIAGHDVFIS